MFDQEQESDAQFRQMEEGGTPTGLRRRRLYRGKAENVTPQQPFETRSAFHAPEGVCENFAGLFSRQRGGYALAGASVLAVLGVGSAVMVSVGYAKTALALCTALGIGLEAANQSNQYGLEQRLIRMAYLNAMLPANAQRQMLDNDGSRFSQIVNKLGSLTSASSAVQYPFALAGDGVTYTGALMAAFFGGQLTRFSATQIEERHVREMEEEILNQLDHYRSDVIEAGAEAYLLGAELSEGLRALGELTPRVAAPSAPSPAHSE